MNKAGAVFVLFAVVFGIAFNAGRGSVDAPPPKRIEVPVTKVKTVTKTVHAKADLPDSCTSAMDAAKVMAKNASPTFNNLAKVEAQLKGSRQDVVLGVNLSSRLEAIRELEEANFDTMEALIDAEYRYDKFFKECQEEME